MLATMATVVVTAAESSGGEAQPAPMASLWSADYETAMRRAVQEKKPVLLDFTGSDWCIWCKRLDAEVFSQKPFVDYARDHLILVTIDFPRHKPQTDAEKRRNDELSKRFDVDVYPTVILLSPNGRVLGLTGYMEGGAKTFVRELKRYVAADEKNGGTAKPRSEAQ